jgi:hypothetical protein
LNWSVIWQLPSELTELIESSPAIVENCRSNGVATADAIVSALAPGRLAVMSTVGKIHVRQIADWQQAIAHDRVRTKYQA